MPIVIGTAVILLMGIFVIASLKAYHIYRLLRDVERELIQEVTHTKNTFKHLVGDLIPEEKVETGKKRKTIQAEEIN